MLSITHYVLSILVGKLGCDFTFKTMKPFCHFSKRLE